MEKPDHLKRLRLSDEEKAYYFNQKTILFCSKCNGIAVKYFDHEIIVFIPNALDTSHKRKLSIRSMINNEKFRYGSYHIYIKDCVDMNKLSTHIKLNYI